MPKTGSIPQETLWNLRRKLEMSSFTRKAKHQLVKETAELFSVDVSTVHRLLRGLKTPPHDSRSDKGNLRKVSHDSMITYCELIAAIKLRTENKKGRHASTTTAIRILEQTGVELDGKIIQSPPGLLKKTTVNRFLQKVGLSKKALDTEDLTTRFQATYSNEVWQFDLSVSDLKDVDEPPDWVAHTQNSKLMIYSIVDDRSRVAYQEYHIVIGEDVIAALKFLYRAMAPKDEPKFQFQGIPSIIYMDNGPIAKSDLFDHVMKALGITIKCHYPKGQGGHKTSCRAKGKVERPFRTVKEIHEILYRFHRPKNETEANEWLFNYLVHYSEQEHPSDSCSRIETWAKNLPENGYMEMCPWDRFTMLARQPKRRKVGNDAKVSFDGREYMVSPELIGSEVTVWIGGFDSDIYVEHNGEKFGPYQICNGVIPFNSFRTAKQTQAEKTRRHIEKIAQEIQVPKDVFQYGLKPLNDIEEKITRNDIPRQKFIDPDPLEQIRFTNEISARKYISRTIGRPIGSLSIQITERIDQLLQETLERSKIESEIKELFKQLRV